MPVIQREVSVLAGAINENVFSGSAFEYATGPQVVSVGITQSATGGFATLQAGGSIIAEEFSPSILTRFPIIPDEMYYNAAMVQGDRLVARYRNPTAGALTVRAIAQIQAVR